MDIPYADAKKIFGEAWAEGWSLPPDLKVSEWSDQHRYLATKSSSEPGRWRTSRTPYLREIMDELSVSSPTEMVVFQAGAQVGKTEAGNNWVGYVIDVEPGPTMIVQTTTQNAKKFSKQRITPLLRETPALAKKVSQNVSRDDSNTTLMKDFPNGFLVITGANSAADLRSMPVRNLFLDEVDGYPDDVDGEGDPVELAIARTATFSNRKIFECSTPTIKNHSRIESDYETSDQRRYMVPCPDCKGFQWLKFANLKFDKADTSTVHYACEHCGVLIEEHHKTWMLENGRWEAQAVAKRGGLVGFHLSSLYSPAGWMSWTKVADKFLAAVARSKSGDFAPLKSFINTVLGEGYDVEQDKVKASEVKRLVSDYRLRSVPTGCLLLTAGVDTQDNRLEVQVIGWGRGEKPTVIDYLVIYGDTSTLEPWDELDKYLDTPFENAFGCSMKIESTAIDAGGHRTHMVYGYARQRKHKGVFAIRGANQDGRPVIGKPSKVDYSSTGKALGGSAEYYQVGTDTAKDLLMGKIKSSLEQQDSAHWNIAFSRDLQDDYFDQLTAETYDATKKRWVKPAGRRNEALDTFVYAIAAAMHPKMRMQYFKEVNWQARQDVLEPKVRDLFSVEQQATATVGNQSQPITPPAKPRTAEQATEVTPPRGLSNRDTGDDWLGDRTVDF